jgi:hypothetical protein
MGELSIADGGRRALRRLLAAGVAAVLIAALWGWVWVLVIGLGQLFSSSQDGGCQQPEYLYGGVLIVLALVGGSTAILGSRRAALVALGRTDDLGYWPHVAVAVLLALGAIATMTVLKPDFTLIPGAC